MGAIKDIVDLSIQLESRVKDRRDIDVLRQIHSLASSLQSEHAEVVERDIRVMQENAALMQAKASLERQLAESQAEEVRIHRLIEFRRGKRTGGKWMAFCPKCHLPVGDGEGMGGRPLAYCTAKHADCGWSVPVPMSVAQVIQELGV
jgi:hypothetical protein